MFQRKKANICSRENINSLIYNTPSAILNKIRDSFYCFYYFDCKRSESNVLI